MPSRRVTVNLTPALDEHGVDLWDVLAVQRYDFEDRVELHIYLKHNSSIKIVAVYDRSGEFKSSRIVELHQHP